MSLKVAVTKRDNTDGLDAVSIIAHKEWCDFLDSLSDDDTIRAEVVLTETYKAFEDELECSVDRLAMVRVVIDSLGEPEDDAIPDVFLF